MIDTVWRKLCVAKVQRLFDVHMRSNSSQCYLTRRDRVVFDAIECDAHMWKGVLRSITAFPPQGYSQADVQAMFEGVRAAMGPDTPPSGVIRKVKGIRE